ncbi:hypothetical protein ACFQZE_24475 [Paenibacillus sp. GCM10027627]|uniref:hypothetical protein n=1 Tax=unclassified Paenibacillus TaxID=185978 RepID=UPI00362953CA
MANIEDYIEKEDSEGLDLIEQAAPAEQQPTGSGFDWGILKAQTGPGQIEEYKTHALNFNGSNAVARILRGLTGMIGELNYAIADILLGVLELLKDNRKKPVVMASHE